MLRAMAGLLMLGLLTKFALGAAEAFLAMSGVGASCFRAWAILTRRSPEGVRWWTTMGFIVGGAVLILFVLVDLMVEGG